MKFSNIAKNVKLGEKVKIYSFVNLYGERSHTKIGTFVGEQNGIIGKNCEISHSFICSGLQLAIMF